MAETMAQAIARRRREREELEAEEQRARASRTRPSSNSPSHIPGAVLAGRLREGALQADAAMRSAANTFTFGGANRLVAGLDALVPVDGQGIRERYATRLAAERSRDQYDAAHRRASGQIGAGTATALGLIGGGGLAAPRLVAGAAKRTARETAALLGAGGVSGLTFQSLSDLTANRQSDWRDGVGAIAGGVLGGAALPLGPGRAAAAGSAATTVAQNVLHGRPVSLEEVGRSAVAGRAIGSTVGLAGRNWSGSLSPQAKGKLGERLGAFRSDVNGMRREPGPKELFKPADSDVGSYPDGRSGDHFFEDKFGPRARLSAGQRIAQRVLGQNYTVYHFLPEHVGKIASLPLTGLAPQLTNQRPTNRAEAYPKAR